MRILLGYQYYRYPVDVRTKIEALAARLRAAGIDVHPVSLTLNGPGPRLKWRELDFAWKWRTPSLMRMYDDLARRAEDYDVFVNWNGINIHPEFIPELPTFNVFACADDPESSENQSRPVAAAFDLSLVGNIAEVETYRSWGVRDARFWPLGFLAEDYDPTLTREMILREERDVDVALLCERDTGWRRERLDRFQSAFPSGRYYGSGWRSGFLPDSARVPLYRRTKVGPNFHNSTGPINYRTYILPANGVMQVCDNKSHLGGIFEIGREVAGFETVEECIDVCRYYLAHDEERREIAANGWERAVRDYNEVAVFNQLVAAVESRRKSVTEPARPILVHARPDVTHASANVTHASANVTHARPNRTTRNRVVSTLAQIVLQADMDTRRISAGLLRRARRLFDRRKLG